MNSWKKKWPKNLKMEENISVKNGDYCLVKAGTHKGKHGVVADSNVSKTGHTTITVIQANGDRFKTLARSVEKINKQ